MRQMLTVSLVLVAAVNTAYADDEYQDRARVLSVSPQVERVNTPRQECRTEYVQERVYEPRVQERSNTGGVIGAVTGGLLGSTIGRGRGRVAAAAVGAGIGAIVGDRVDNSTANNSGREHIETRPVERCYTVDNWSNMTTGYLVQYEYNGHQYSTVMDRDPGPTFPVVVAVRPALNGVSDYRPAAWQGRPPHHAKERNYW